MTDLVAPNSVASVTIDTEEYTPDDQGVVTAKTPEHAVVLKLHGFIDKAEAFGYRFGQDIMSAARSFEPLGDDERAAFQRMVDDAKAREDHLMSTLQSLMADVAALKAAGSGTPAAPAATPSGTSESLGEDNEDEKDDLAAPDLSAATRDDIVKWLNAKGVSTPGNVSRDAAVELAKQNGAE